MDSVASAAFLSWKLDPRVLAVLLVMAFVYLRGWMRMRRLAQDQRDQRRLAAFLAGLALLFVATESPLDSLDQLFLSAHMAQHLLLMVVVPPLLLLGDPFVPLLRGLPKDFVREALAPFLTWAALRRAAGLLVSPAVAWTAFAASTIFWHLPTSYGLALHSPFWHTVQHASFFWTGILFWWPVVQPAPQSRRSPVWLLIPYLLFADVLNTALSAFFVFSGRLLYPSYGSWQGGSSALNDQILAGLIMWVPGSLIYLVPAFVFAMRMISGASARSVAVVQVGRKGVVTAAGNRAKLLPLVRRIAQVAMLLLAIAVIADGFFGTQIAPMNLAGVLPWVHWRALSLLGLLVIGNVFCMSCPFMLVRDGARRLLPAKWRWPRWLRTKWLAAALLLAYLWAYEAFGLWNSPWLTAWIIVAYFAAAVAVDGFFRGASFCKYVCPIGQFHFVSSLVSPREVRVRSSAVCQSCRTYDCIRGNERARGCELYLFQPKKVGNLDCTLCMDCVKACPHDNVALLATSPTRALVADVYRSSIGKLSRRTDFAAIALLIVFGAFVNAAGMTAPVMNWEHLWHFRLGSHTMPAIIAAFVVTGAVILSAIAVLLCAALNRLTGLPVKAGELARRFVFALVPLGVAMWAAHLLYHLLTAWNAPAITFGRMVSAPFVPEWLTPVQILLLDAGLLFTIYAGWRVANEYGTRLSTALRILAPWAVLSCSLYAAGVWIFLQPMQMRGMVH